MPLPPPLIANGASYVRFFIPGTDFGRFTISSFLVVANLVCHGGFVVTSVGHRTNGRLPYMYIIGPFGLKAQVEGVRGVARVAAFPPQAAMASCAAALAR